MERTNIRLTKYRAESATDNAIHYAQEEIAHAMAYLADSAKAGRKKSLECKFCFYFRSSRIGGCAMTKANCAVCNKDVMYGSTNVDLLCKECAGEHKLCCRCGGDVEMKPRRKFDFLPA